MTTAQSNTTTVPVEDRLAIQELAARYTFRCDTKHYDEIGELFADDGVWDETVVGLPLCEGRAAIHQFFCSMAQADLEYVVHINGSHSIMAFTGDTASAAVHLHVRGRFNGSDIEILGYYADDYVKAGGEWLFKHRKLIEIAPSTGFGG
jgi:hypothetical protein